jgi:signal transduction histidine kinase
MKVKNRLWQLIIFPSLILLLGLFITKSIFMQASEKYRSYTLSHNKKKTVLFKIYSEMGYDASIHNFKNYIIRQDTEYFVTAKKSIQKSIDLIEEYENFSGIDQFEWDQLAIIKNTLKEYDQNLDLARESVKKDQTIKEIDILVKVDDRPAAQAMRELSSYILEKETAEEAKFFSASERAENIALLFIFLSAISIVFIGNKMTNNVLKSLSSLVDFAHKLRANNSDPLKPIPNMDSWDEFKEVQESMLALNKKNQNVIKRLERLNTNVNQFAFSASHDLQEPLKKISTYIDFMELELAKVKESTSLNEYFSQVKNACDRMIKLINALLEYSRHMEVEFRPNPVDLNAVVDYCISDLEIYLKNKKNIELDIQDLPTVMGDQSMLHSLLLNLISNAIKFHRENAPMPKVKVYAERINEHWKIIVEDNGIGFNESEKNNILRPFHRLNSKQSYAGTGIGLATSSKILEHHGSYLEIQSEPGIGSSFSFLLPAVGSLNEELN